MMRPHAARGAWFAALLALTVIPALGANQEIAGCRISGRAAAGGTALPGVSIIVTVADAVKAVTSSALDGTFQLALPSGSYTVRAELTGFGPLEQTLELGAAPCDRQLTLELSLLARTPRAAPAAAAGSRFETVAVQTQAAAAAGLEVNPPDRETMETARLLLPPGFTTEGPTEAVAIMGSMASIDRGMLNDRLAAIGRGELDPMTGDLAQGFGPGFDQFQGPGGRGGPGGPGGFGGRGGGPDGRGGGRGGPGDGAFVIGGRGGRQNAYTAQANYTFGGSVLDSTPYQLRPDSPVAKQPYNRQNYGGTVGGPVKIPGVYDGTRRTTFTVNYGGNRGGDLFDQYATVPSEAIRNGDFSFAPRQLIDPATGTPFLDNQIPLDRMSASSLALMRFIPLPNLPGTTRNFHFVSTVDSAADNVNVRVTHNFTPPPAGRGGRGRAGGPGGGRGGPGGRGGRGNQQGTTVVLNGQLQYRHNSGEQLNVFPDLGGRSTGSTFSTPIGLNIVHRRQLHNVNVNYSRTTARSLNRYAFRENVAGDAGIEGVATAPFDWGVPGLSFSSLSSVRDVAPSDREDTRLTLAYTWTRPVARHTLRIGGDVRWDSATSRTDPNANGTFVFTGLHTSGGQSSARGGGLDFADFLLGLPQQASVQYGPGRTTLSSRSMSLFVQDDWRKSTNLTFNLGVRYELLRPFLEENGIMVNLDAAPDFSSVTPVVSGGTGSFTGAFPDTLVLTDANNVAPRVGFAYRLAPGTVLRGGYGIGFNSGSYSAIARQMVSQPPFAATNTSIGSPEAPLSISDPFAAAQPNETTNNYGINKSYDLGLVQTWNADISRDLNPVWNVGAGYTHTRGSSLDIVRAPNRGPDGLRIEGVQPFLWQSSEGASRLHAATFRMRRRPVRGIGGGVTYTLARSRDNASTIGGGGTVVAQDDRNLDAEWGLSSFDRMHQLTADGSVELPFGRNRPWLNNGGFWASLLADWRVSTTFVWQSGTPYTARVVGAAADVARGTNGTLRADYNGEPIGVSDPTIDRFFNTSAFSVPLTGAFGNSTRNLIVGPGSRLLNAQIARDVRLGGTRVISLQVNANNLLNLVNYAAIDTTVNSPTFGQVLSVRPMRTVQLNVRFRF
jgi:trimeric autotransporter adhesin